LVFDLLNDLVDELGVTGYPAGVVLRLRSGEDEVVLGAVILPAFLEVFNVGVLALAHGVQPDDQRVGDLRVVLLGDVNPVVLVLGIVGALDQTLGRRLVLFLGRFVLFLAHRRRHVGQRFLRLQGLLLRAVFGQPVRNRVGRIGELHR